MQTSETLSKTDPAAGYPVARSERFARVSAGIDCETPIPLLAIGRLKPEVFDRLHRAARFYLSRILSPDGRVLEEDEILDRIARQDPPFRNVTPTGMILPKNYSVLEFNLFMREFYSAMESLGFGQVVEAWHVPMHIRVKYPLSTEENLNRPRHAPEDLHADCWSGYSSQGITVLVPLLGDIENNNVGFYRPKRPFDAAWLSSPHLRGEKGMPFEDFERFEWAPQRGEVHMMDAALLHATKRNPNCGVRLSIDNICLPREDIPGEQPVIEAGRQGEIERHADLLEIGKSWIYAFPDGDEHRKESRSGTIDPTNFVKVPLPTRND